MTNVVYIFIIKKIVNFDKNWQLLFQSILV